MCVVMGGLWGGERVFNVRLYWIPLVQVRGRGGREGGLVGIVQ